MTDFGIKNISSSIFNITENVEVDESVKRLRYIEYIPTQTDPNNTNLSITVDNREAFTRIQEAYLKFEGSILKDDNTRFADADVISLQNGGVLEDFDIAIKAGTATLENINETGKVFVMEGLLSNQYGFSMAKGLAQFYSYDSTDDSGSSGFKERRFSMFKENEAAYKGDFTIIIPLSSLFGIAKYYEKVTHGVLWSIVLNRCRKNDSIFNLTAVPGGAGGAAAIPMKDAKIVFSKISLHVPDYEPGPFEQAKLLTSIKNKVDVTCAFMGKQMEKKVVNQSKNFRMDICITNGPPRYVIVGFQKDRQKPETNKAIFDHLNLNSISVALNSDIESSIEDCNFDNNKYMTAYKRFTDLCMKFDNHIPEISPKLFKKLYSLFVFDVSCQPEKLKAGPINLVLKADFEKNVPKDTMVYVLIYYDKFVRFSTDGEKQVLAIN